MGVYETLRKAASAVGLELSLEAHAYLNQEDNEFLQDFLREKTEAYNGEENYLRALGVPATKELEDRMTGALSFAYFYSLPDEKLKKSAEFLRCHSKAGRTVLEKTMLRAATETLAARVNGPAHHIKGLKISFAVFLLAAYTSAILHKITAAFIFFFLSAFTFILRASLRKSAKKEFFQRTARSGNSEPSENPELRKAAADMLGRFYPGFDW